MTHSALAALTGQLREVSRVSQPAGEPFRRWFYGAWDDLTVWLDSGGRPIGFQYCYRLPGPHRALTYLEDQGFDHSTVDEARGAFGAPASELLHKGGTVEAQLLVQRFRSVAELVPSAIRDFVESKIGTCSRPACQQGFTSQSDVG